MKTKIHPPALLTAAFLSGSMLLGQFAKAEVKPVQHFIVPIEDPKEDKKPAKKEKNNARYFSSLNNEAVKIYPDIIKREMHVVAKDNDGKELNFFVFDISGNLMQQYKMKARDHYRISGLKKGIYIYRVFAGDEETATGKFEIR